MNKAYLNTQNKCPNYNGESRLGFKVLQRVKGHKKDDIEVVNSSILFIVEGEVLLTYNNNFEVKLSAGQFVFLPQGTRLALTALEDIKLVRCWFDIYLMQCDYFRLDMLEPYIDESQKKYFPLTYNESIRMYLELIEKYLGDGFICSCLYKYKHQELFFLLRAFFSKGELATFFAPALGEDMFFINSVLKYYPQVQNVADLANKMNYSLSGFRKKFEKSVGQSAFSWLQDKRSDSILNDLNENKMTNKDIIDKYDFSSDARFYEFCKRIYGKTPSQIRKKNEEN